MNRLFILGDSWMYNYFQKPMYNELTAYFEKLNSLPYHVEDYFKHYYEVFNYSYGGVSNQDIINQFSRIPEFKEGDRLIVNWTSPLRFTIKRSDGYNFTFGDFNVVGFEDENHPVYIPPILQDSVKGKLKILTKGIETLEIIDQQEFYENEFNIIPYLKRVHSNYKPVFMSWDPLISSRVDVEDISYGCETFINQKATITQEYDFCDPHLGGIGNWLLYKFLHNKLELNKPVLDLKTYPVTHS